MGRRGLPLLASFFTAACGAAGNTPAPPALVFSQPSETSVVYLRGDTATVEVDFGDQSFDLERQSHAEWGVEFGSNPAGLQVTATLRDYRARLRNPMAPARTASSDQVEGTLVFTLDRRGEATVASVPRLSGTAAEFLTPEEIAAQFFPRLPGSAVSVGDAWTDTIVVEAETQLGAVTSMSVLTYTAVGDTILAGRPHLLVAFSGTSERTSEGSMGGFDMSQSLSGTSEGRFAWDHQRSLLHSSAWRSDLSGTMEISAAPVPLSIRIRSVVRTILHQM